MILQPSYIPWRGYFHQIWRADRFVFFDDVPYDRGGWRNRNRIKATNGPVWLTVPVHAKGFREGITIEQIAIAWDVRPQWNVNHIKTIRNAYAKAPFFETYAPLLERELLEGDELLADLDIRLTKALAAALGITETRFIRSSSLGITGGQTERLVRIVQSTGADHYISGPSAAGYLDEALFRDAGISVEYMQYDYPEYQQLRRPYDPRLSVVDLLMMVGPDASKYIWGT